MQFRAVMEKYRQDLLAKNKEGSPLADAGPVTFGTRLNCSHFPGGYEAISYGRGTWLFHMLRSMSRGCCAKPRRAPRRSGGRQRTLRTLRRMRHFCMPSPGYETRFQERAIDTREFLQVFEEELPPSLRYEGHKSLDWFYEGWMNGTAIPHLELQSVKYTQARRNGGHRHNCAKERAQGTGDGRSGLCRARGKECAAGPGIRRRSGNKFPFVCSAGTRKVVLDPIRRC